LPLANGLPAGAWLALRRGNELLDRRILDPSWGGWDFEVEVDPVTQVDVLISSGEGMNTEFRVQLPESDPDKAMKTVAAFANGGGGSLLFGVDDDGHVVGLDGSRSREDADRLTSLITERVRPLVDFDLQIVDYEDLKIILVEVKSGGQPPYGVGTTDHKIAYHVRRGATTFPAAPVDLNNVVRSRIPSSPARPSGPLGRR
jgi:predicted HTH transcriptional regulator